MAFHVSVPTISNLSTSLGMPPPHAVVLQKSGSYDTVVEGTNVMQTAAGMVFLPSTSQHPVLLTRQGNFLVGKVLASLHMDFLTAAKARTFSPSVVNKYILQSLQGSLCHQYE